MTRKRSPLRQSPARPEEPIVLGIERLARDVPEFDEQDCALHGRHDLTVDGRAMPGSGVGRFCCALIRQGLPEEEIAERTRRKFGGRTTVHCVRWYASRLRRGMLSG